MIFEEKNGRNWLLLCQMRQVRPRKANLSYETLHHKSGVGMEMGGKLLNDRGGREDETEGRNPLTGKQKGRHRGAGGSQEEGGVGEMALWLRILAPLPGDSGPTPSICRVATVLASSSTWHVCGAQTSMKVKQLLT